MHLCWACETCGAQRMHCKMMSLAPVSNEAALQNVHPSSQRESQLIRTTATSGWSCSRSMHASSSPALATWTMRLQWNATRLQRLPTWCSMWMAALAHCSWTCSTPHLCSLRCVCVCDVASVCRCLLPLHDSWWLHDALVLCPCPCEHDCLWFPCRSRYRTL